MSKIFTRPVILYICIVAAIYLLVFIVGILYLGDGTATSLKAMKRLWMLPLLAVGLSAGITAGSILRFGNEGGSVFAIPSLTHCFMLAIFIFTFVSST